LPRQLSAIGPRHRSYSQDGWSITTPRHAPSADLEGQLTFALKYEGLDLAVLKVLFRAVGSGPIEEIVTAQPTGRYARRLWFLYEWLLGTVLDLPDAGNGVYVPVVDPELQWATEGTTSTRHRVRNNLPGTPLFCPMIFRTETLRVRRAQFGGTRPHGRGRCARRPARPHGGFSAAERFEIEL
jgi:hypothetical protein